MAAPMSLPEILKMMGSTSTVAKQEGASSLKRYALRYNGEALGDVEVNGAIDACLSLVKSNQTQLRVLGLESLLVLSQELASLVQRHTNRTYKILIDCLSDKKQEVKDGILAICLQFASITNPSKVLERLHPAFVHKTWTITQQALVITKELLKIYRQQIIDSTLITSVYRLVSAAKPDVREEAISTIAAMYQILAHENREKFRNGIQRRKQPGESLEGVWAVLDNVDKNSANASESHTEPSLPAKPEVSHGPKAPVRTHVVNARALPSTKIAGKYALIDETEFNTFSNCEPMRWAMTDDILDSTLDRLEKYSNEEWDKRRDELRTIRSCLNSGVTDLPSYKEQMKRMIPFIRDNIVLDLRSQVSKEACVTLCHIAHVMRERLEVYVPDLINTLMKLLHRNQFFKECADCTMKQILALSFSVKLLPVVFMVTIRDKFDDKRTKTAELMALILRTWDRHWLDRLSHIDSIIRSGLTDAQGECRLYSRQAFIAYELVFPEQAKMLFASLQPSKFKEILQKERIQCGLGEEAVSSTISRKDVSRSATTHSSRPIPGRVTQQANIVRSSAAARGGRPSHLDRSASTLTSRGARVTASGMGRSSTNGTFTNKASHPMRANSASKMMQKTVKTTIPPCRSRNVHINSKPTHGHNITNANDFAPLGQPVLTSSTAEPANIGKALTSRLGNKVLSQPVRVRITGSQSEMREKKATVTNAPTEYEVRLKTIISSMDDSTDKDERRKLLNSLLVIITDQNCALDTMPSLAEPILDILNEWTKDKRATLSQDLFLGLGEFCFQVLSLVSLDSQITTLLGLFNRIGSETFNNVLPSLKTALRRILLALEDDVLLDVCFACLTKETLTYSGKRALLHFLANDLLPVVESTSLALCKRYEILQRLSVMAVDTSDEDCKSDDKGASQCARSIIQQLTEKIDNPEITRKYVAHKPTNSTESSDSTQTHTPNTAEGLEVTQSSPSWQTQHSSTSTHIPTTDHSMTSPMGSQMCDDDVEMVCADAGVIVEDNCTTPGSAYERAVVVSNEIVKLNLSSEEDVACPSSSTSPLVSALTACAGHDSTIKVKPHSTEFGRSESEPVQPSRDRMTNLCLPVILASDIHPQSASTHNVGSAHVEVHENQVHAPTSKGSQTQTKDKPSNVDTHMADIDDATTGTLMVEGPSIPNADAHSRALVHTHTQSRDEDMQAPKHATTPCRPVVISQNESKIENAVVTQSVSDSGNTKVTQSGGALSYSSAISSDVSSLTDSDESKSEKQDALSMSTSHTTITTAIDELINVRVDAPMILSGNIVDINERKNEESMVQQQSNDQDTAQQAHLPQFTDLREVGDGITGMELDSNEGASTIKNRRTASQEHNIMNAKISSPSVCVPIVQSSREIELFDTHHHNNTNGTTTQMKLSSSVGNCFESKVTNAIIETLTHTKGSPSSKHMCDIIIHDDKPIPTSTMAAVDSLGTKKALPSNFRTPERKKRSSLAHEHAQVAVPDIDVKIEIDCVQEVEYVDSGVSEKEKNSYVDEDTIITNRYISDSGENENVHKSLTPVESDDDYIVRHGDSANNDTSSNGIVLEGTLNDEETSISHGPISSSSRAGEIRDIPPMNSATKAAPTTAVSASLAGSTLEGKSIKKTETDISIDAREVNDAELNVPIPVLPASSITSVSTSGPKTKTLFGIVKNVLASPFKSGKKKKFTDIIQGESAGMDVNDDIGGRVLNFNDEDEDAVSTTTSNRLKVEDGKDKRNTVVGDAERTNEDQSAVIQK
eukprot:CFRG4795T1